MNTILFVDDEENVLHGLKRMLRPMRNEWDMSFVVGGKAAIEMIQNKHFEVIVTDMRMPEVDGLAVLEFVKKYDPSIARIVLSGQTDKEKVLTFSGIAHQLISKPCEAETLLEAVKSSLKLKEGLEDRSLAKLVGSIDSLPSLPAIYQELSEAMNKEPEDISLTKVAEIMAADMSMSAKILQIANSPYFGSSSKIETLKNAAVFLGTEMIRSLSLTESIFREFTPSDALINLDELWNKSIVVAAASGLLAREENLPEAVIGQVHQSGALHAIGILVLTSLIPEKYSQVMKAVSDHGMPLHQAEIEVLGKDHGAVGGYLLGLWGLPLELVGTVTYHLSPGQSDKEEKGVFSSLSAVHVANAAYLSYKEGNGEIDDYIDQEWLVKMGFTNKLEKWVEIAHRSFSKDEEL